MCLSSVSEQYDQPSSFIQDGWKKFGGSVKNPEFENQTLRGYRGVPLNQWLKADNSTMILATDNTEYELGFHVWPEESEGRSGRRRVFVRYLTTRGMQSNEEVVIARELYVPSDPNSWPPKPGDPSTPKKKEGLLT